jgi:hypothetical protein
MLNTATAFRVSRAKREGEPVAPRQRMRRQALAMDGGDAARALFLPHASCSLLHASCFMLHASCFMLHASCFMLHASCFMLHASRFLLRASDV